MSADRNLLFGILALQLNFVTRDQLVEGMHTWVLDKTRTLGELFVAAAAMDAHQFKLLDALVDKHVEKHGGDIEQSLQQLSSVDPDATQLLNEIQDTDLQATISHFSFKTVDPYATQAFEQSPKRSTGRFRIIRPHAKGGLGEVFVAEDTELSREVALKEIQDRFADNDDSRERFLREAEITGRLEHPGIVPVYGLGTYDNGRPFYAMKFIKGDSLKDAIDKFHSDPETKAAKSFMTGSVGSKFRELLGRFIDVCHAVHYAHSRGILHRDLKPGNVMIGEYGETLVVDWGLAKVLGEQVGDVADASVLTPITGSGSAPTMLGAAIGTPAYMSPEQASGDWIKVDSRSDVFSLGAVLYHLVVGRAPFVASTPAETLELALKSSFVSPSEVSKAIPKNLTYICLKALNRSPENRYLSSELLALDVQNLLFDLPISACREGLIDRVARSFRRSPSSFLLASNTFVAIPMLLIFVGLLEASALSPQASMLRLITLTLLLGQIGFAIGASALIVISALKLSTLKNALGTTKLMIYGFAGSTIIILAFILTIIWWLSLPPAQPETPQQRIGKLERKLEKAKREVEDWGRQLAELQNDEK